MPYKNKEDRYARERERRKTNPEHLNRAREWQKQYKKREIEKHGARRDSEETEVRRRRAKKYRLNLRAYTLKIYGSVCQCCGEDRIDFLAIDHINRDGQKNREEIGGKNYSPSKFYGWLVNNGKPREGFRVLCHNCNFATRFGEKCPHESDQRSTVETVLGISSEIEIIDMLAQGLMISDIASKTGADPCTIRRIHKHMEFEDDQNLDLELIK